MSVKLTKPIPFIHGIDFQDEEKVLNDFKPVKYKLVLGCGSYTFGAEVEIPTVGYQPKVICPVCENEIALPAYTSAGFISGDPARTIIENHKSVNKLLLAGASFIKHTFIRFEYLTNPNTLDYWFKANNYFQRRQLRENY